MSPEALSKKKYSEKSDVWSFGCTCFEILAEKTPYPEISELPQVAAEVIYNNHHPKFPNSNSNGEKIPEKLITLEKLVFSFDAQDRPTFISIVKLLE